MLSPDGTKVAFAAVGDIWVMPVGGAAENITKDRFLDTDPAWSPDGTKLVYSSDKGGNLLQLWIRDMATGQERQLTTLTTQPQGATWSNDGTKIAFFDVDGMWRRAQVSVVDVASGQVTRIHDALFSPGTPTWSPDGTRVAVAMVSSYSTRFREGTNQVLTMSSKGGDDKWFVPDAEPVDRLARRRRRGVVARRHEDGGHLRRAAEGVAGLEDRRSRSARRGASRPRWRTRRAGPAIRSGCSTSRWTSCGSSTSRPARPPTCR